MMPADCSVRRTPTIPGINPFCFVFCDSGFYESTEQRMRTVRAGLQFRMSLCSDEERVIRKFYHFHDTSIRRNTGEHHAVFCEHFAVIVVKFITMTMTFMNRFFTVKAYKPGKIYPVHKDKNQVLRYRRYPRCRPAPAEVQ